MSRAKMSPAYIQWLQAARTVEAFTFDGAWFDIGTPASYLR